MPKIKLHKLIMLTNTVKQFHSREDSVGFGWIQHDSVGFGRIWQDSVGFEWIRQDSPLLQS
jgi:hypothetical protein